MFAVHDIQVSCLLCLDKRLARLVNGTTRNTHSEINEKDGGSCKAPTNMQTYDRKLSLILSRSALEKPMPLVT